ncbi:diphthine synthase [Lineolata rhizophorae]|uniref:Diphthine methyl ester synthase n=1 Tax=Lineolata rhizophorae TaxID=578093 RepID=A0A6A6NUZ8_9PEZI|nr:diphthine synthase [Lineolata rhizophorae]
MLYIIGLGLADEKDISVKGLEIVKRAERVYLEAYTAILLVEKGQLEAFYGRPVIVATRETVESSSDEILDGADKADVAFLVVGDPFSATTHADLLLRARALSIPTRTLPNASILTAVGATGLSLYTFGQTVSLVFFTPSWRPASFYDRLAENARVGLHSLVLLDIKVREPDLAMLARGKIVYEAPRYMSASVAARQMIEVEEGVGPDDDMGRDAVEGRSEGVCTRGKLAVAVARLGSEGQKVVAGTLEQIASDEVERELGKPLHSLVLVGRRMHEVEMEALMDCAVDKTGWEETWRKEYNG